MQVRALLNALAAMPRAAEPEKIRLRSAGIHVDPKAVGDSEDLERVLGLPRRASPTRAEQIAFAAKWTEILRRHNPACRCRQFSAEPCLSMLNPIQGWYLEEASRGAAAGIGVLGHIKVGGGKTGIDVLTPMVVPGERFVLLIPSNLREQFRIDYLRWSEHFRTPNVAGGAAPFDVTRPVLTVLAYSELSRPQCAAWLTAQRPDAIIADEAQNLKDRKSVRTGRFLRYFVENSQTRFYAHSGTLTTRGIEDFQHLAALALREGSPLPINPDVAERWGEVLNPARSEYDEDNRPPAGQLLRLCVEGETARDGFRRRLLATQGVVATDDARLDTPLRLLRRDPGKLPQAVADALAFVRYRKKRPDEEELEDALEMATVCKQVASGFYYRWKYPRGEPKELIDEWFLRRQEWRRAVRERLLHRVDGMDSPHLCAQAAERAVVYKATGKRPDGLVWACRAWEPWLEIKDQVQPEPDTVWIDTFLAEDAARWAQEAPGIVWYLHSAFGRKVAELGRLAFFGAGEAASAAILQERGQRSIVASIKAHGTGKNLQTFNRSLVANLPSDGAAWEQLIGRTHRHGQSKAVDVFLYQHTEEMREALTTAFRFAEYTQQTSGSAQKLLFADDLTTAN